MEELITNVNYYAFYLADIIFERNHIDKICDHLFIGNIYSALNEEYIKSSDINVVVNCSTTIPFIDCIKYKYRLAIIDNEKEEEIEKMTRLMDKYIDIVNTHIENKKNVLVHCKAGVQRSATIVVGYLMKYKNYNLEEAIDYVKNIRPCIMTPTPHFIKSLIEYNKFISH